MHTLHARPQPHGLRPDYRIGRGPHAEERPPKTLDVTLTDNGNKKSTISPECQGAAKYPTPFGISCAFSKDLVSCGVVTVSAGTCTLNVCAGNQYVFSP
jgi:hypothetical protein